MSNNIYNTYILNTIPNGARVLDLGCGDGDLLDQLRKEKNCQGYGIDIQYDHILACTKRGISTFHGNIDEGLSDFSDHAFDYVILSQTLQQVTRPLYVIEEMLRVGHKAIITFPNFGYWEIRLQLLLTGQAPKTKTLPYEWYDTPNIRVVSIRDFRHLCDQNNIKILSDNQSNLFSKKGLFVVESGKTD